MKNLHRGATSVVAVGGRIDGRHSADPKEHVEAPLVPESRAYAIFRPEIFVFNDP
jgi:hypothetical protein